jgi:hypothetical protein
MADSEAPSFDSYYEWMLANWPDRATAQHCLSAVHRFDLERAAQPPVVNVALAGVPGHFTGTAGNGDVTYVPPSPQSLT